MSIKDFPKKINYLLSNINEDLIIVLIIILVATGSFGLGRLSKIEEIKQSIIIKDAILPSDIKTNYSSSSVGQKSQPGLLVASKKGQKYHYPWCSGAQRISEKNKIYFNSIKEAQGAGYEPAANCKGL